jgi:hypothetical protein
LHRIDNLSGKVLEIFILRAKWKHNIPTIYWATRNNESVGTFGDARLSPVDRMVMVYHESFEEGLASWRDASSSASCAGFRSNQALLAAAVATKAAPIHPGTPGKDSPNHR